MRLYLTGAASHAAPQPDPSRSFGGQVASTPLENATEGNLFGALGRQALLKSVTRYRLLALRNETGQPVTDLAVALAPLLDANGQEQADPFCRWELALVLPAVSPEGMPRFESLGRDIGRPYYADFQPGLLSLDEPLLPGTWLGIWLRQTPLGLPAEFEDTVGPPAEIVMERTLSLTWT